MDDTSGNWVKYEANPVLRAGRHNNSNIGNDFYNLSDCCVIREGDLYKMWYTSSGPTSESSVNHCNISYAESSNGTDWVKNPGNPVFDIDPYSWDRYAVETVTVLRDETEGMAAYKMWYSGRTKDKPGDPGYDIGYAFSSDGIHWTRYGPPVLERGGLEQWDNYFLEGPTVIKDNGAYGMWYAGMDAVSNGQPSDGKVCIGYASSQDGIHWVKNSQPVLLPGNTSSWDFKTVQDPCVIKYDNVYYMWFGGKTSDYSNYGQQTGFARSLDGVNWEKSPANPVIKRGSPGQWDAVTASYGSVLFDGTKLEIWYTGMNRDYDPPISVPEYWDIGYAFRIVENSVISE